MTDTELVAILRISEAPMDRIAADRIEALAAEVNGLRADFNSNISLLALQTELARQAHEAQSRACGLLADAGYERINLCDMVEAVLDLWIAAKKGRQ